ncbi:hypothetical protein U1Q18_017200 [Sarracenia purpurea var. burkii]
MQSVYTTLVNLNLDKQFTVTTAHLLAILEASYPSSSSICCVRILGKKLRCTGEGFHRSVEGLRYSGKECLMPLMSLGFIAHCARFLVFLLLASAFFLPRRSSCDGSMEKENNSIVGIEFEGEKTLAEHGVANREYRSNSGKDELDCAYL